MTQFPSSHQATDPLRVLRRGGRGGNDQPLLQQPGVQATSAGSYSATSSSPYSAGPKIGYPELPVAFLNLDFVILKSNQAFQDLLSFLGDVRNKNLTELLEPSRQTDVLHRLRNELRDERDERDPSYMPPITPVGENPMEAVAEGEVDRISEGFTDRRHVLHFRTANGQSQPLETQIRLGKTKFYLVTLVVHLPLRSAAPPLLTSQLAPPTPIHASQTLSAPTSGPSREFGSYRPASSASSAPTSPYYSFSRHNSIAQGHAGGSSYASSPSYGYSPTSGPDHGYFQTYQQQPQPSPYPSPYPPISRRGSTALDTVRRPETSRDGNPTPRMGSIQLPPIRTTPQAGPSPLGSDLSESAKERVRRREESPRAFEPAESPDTGKRRRLNIHEVLE